MDRNGLVYVDFDGVIANSIKAICECCEIKDFGEVTGIYDPSKVLKWDFVDVIPYANAELIEKLFDSDLFWSRLEMFDGVREFFSLYRDRIVVCSIGNIVNQQKKLAWIHKNLGKVNCMPIVTDMSVRDKPIGKYLINMTASDVFIEDSGKNLDESTSGTKILFNNYGNFNAEWARCNSDNYRVTNWDEIIKILE